MRAGVQSRKSLDPDPQGIDTFVAGRFVDSIRDIHEVVTRSLAGDLVYRIRGGGFGDGTGKIEHEHRAASDTRRGAGYRRNSEQKEHADEKEQAECGEHAQRGGGHVGKEAHDESKE